MKVSMIPLCLCLCLASPLRVAVAAPPCDDYLRSAGEAAAASRWLDESNWLTRALEWDRLGTACLPVSRLELEARRAAANDKWEASLSAPDPSPEPRPAPAKRKERRARKEKEDPVDVRRVIAKADAARRSGRLETALRLYRAAARLPGGEDAAASAASVAAEVGDQPER